MSLRANIINYYLLCTVSQGGKSLLINQVVGPVHTILNMTETERYTKKVDGALIARESVVGGEECNKIQVF